MPSQDCPLCKHESIPYIGADYGRSKVFNCPKCKVFVLPQATEHQLQTAPSDWLDALSKESSSVALGKLLFIAFNNEGNLTRTQQSEDKWL